MKAFNKKRKPNHHTKGKYHSPVIVIHLTKSIIKYFCCRDMSTKSCVTVKKMDGCGTWKKIKEKSVTYSKFISL